MPDSTNKHKREKPSWYINPWGLGGGLFGSATIVVSLATSYQSSLFGIGFIGFISVLIMVHGFLHSKVMAENNDLWALTREQNKILLHQNEIIHEQHALLEKVNKFAHKCKDKKETFDNFITANKKTKAYDA